MQVEISRLQDVLRRKDAQLDEHTATSQRQLREKEERERELLAQLQRKEAELEQRNADITRLQRQVQRNADISKHSGEVDPVRVVCILLNYTGVKSVSVLLSIVCSG